MANELSANTMSKKARILFLIGVFVSNVIMMGDYFAYPTVNLLYEKFATQTFWVNFFVSGPYLVIAAFSPVAGKLCNKYSKRTLMCAGGIIAAVTAVLFLAVDNIYYMCLMKALYAVGYSLIQMVAVAFIAEIYEDPNQRATIMGYYNASVSLSGVIMSSAAGYLSVESLKAGYRGYWSFIPVAVIMLLTLPKAKPPAQVETKNIADSVDVGKKESLSVGFWLLTVAFVVFCLAVQMIYFFISTYVAEHNLGDTIFVGNLGSIRIAFCFFVGLSFGWIMKHLGKYLAVIGYTLGTVSFLMLAMFPSKVLTVVFFTLLGVSFTSVYNYTYTFAPMIAGKGRTNDAIAIVVGLFSLACFFPTYCVQGIMALLNTTMFTPVISVCAGIGAVCAIVSVFVMLRLNKEDTV